MDTRFVETFLMAVDNGSVAEAARRLNLTPAAVAKKSAFSKVKSAPFYSLVRAERSDRRKQGWRLPSAQDIFCRGARFQVNRSD